MATDDRWVRDEVERLVAYPTVSNRPVTALAAHVAQRAEDLGFSVERFDVSADKGSVIASIGPEDAEGGLVLSGHLDVVPTENQPWTSDPFRVVERDGKLFGRGTADMKGFVAAACAGLARIAAHAKPAVAAVVSNARRERESFSFMPGLYPESSAAEIDLRGLAQPIRGRSRRGTSRGGRRETGRCRRT
jgi:acetylornithine deacetylase/succinyl-diaminopimelate desuccinylase-like protein